MLRLAISVAASLVIAGCAARRPPVVAPTTSSAPDLRAADSLIDEGCYTCLQQAFQIYAAAGDTDRQFSTALLLAMREKELGLDATPWIERARAMPAATTGPYVDIVSALPWTTVATASDFDAPRPSAETVQQWLGFLTRPDSQSVLDRYVWLALTCSRPATAASLDGVQADRPLLQYRLGLCGLSQRPQLDSVFAASPRFVEAGFFLARYEMVNGTARQRISRALPLLTDAHAALPQAPVITVTLATVWRARNEFARALALYDDALTLRPAQRDALLGRVMALTYLGRGTEAIATASTMIELGTWYLGDAYYFRAWNRYQLGQLALAAADVAEARQLQRSGELLTLAGMIAYDQQRRNDARADFDAARAMNPTTNCPAMWYLGLINLDEQSAAPARDMFASASACYRSAAATARDEMEQLPPDLSPEALAQQQRDYQRRIVDNLRQEARSALNTALLSQQLGNRESAVTYARIALGHDLTRERAQAVLDRTAQSTGSAP